MNTEFIHLFCSCAAVFFSSTETLSPPRTALYLARDQMFPFMMTSLCNITLTIFRVNKAGSTKGEGTQYERLLEHRHTHKHKRKCIHTVCGEVISKKKIPQMLIKFVVLMFRYAECHDLNFPS